METDRTTKTGIRRRDPSRDTSPAIYLHGRLLTYHNGEAWTMLANKSKRKEITMFTPASRLRLLKCLATIDLEASMPAVFFTLTYPDSHLPRSNVQRTSDRSRFVQEVERMTGKPISGLWRAEWEERKSGEHEGKYGPHFHLLAFGLRFFAFAKTNDLWRRIIGSNTYVRTETKGIRNPRKTAYYCAKYLAKCSNLSLVNAAYLNKGRLGRLWGWMRPRLIKRLPSGVIDNPTSEMIGEVLRTAREQWPENDIRQGESFTLMGGYVPALAKKLAGIDLTGTGESH